MLFYIFYAVALATLAHAHGVILAAQGEVNSPTSVGFQVDKAIARNCTTISPCQLDTTLIRDSEITANVVNECGRTELTGNIDIGENTENALAAGAVTQVKSGTLVTVTIHQVNADGAGPYACQLEETSNNGVFTHNLTVTNNVPGVNGFSQAKTQDFNITVAMPQSFACSGASTGNVCTVRCRNNALAGPFGGCFAVQQTDVTPSKNSADTIKTSLGLDAVLKQVAQNNQDLPAAVAANQVAGSDNAKQNAAAVAAILSNTIISKAAPTQTPAVINQPATRVATNPAATQTVARGNTQGNNTRNNQNARERNNMKRSGGLRWAKRILYGDI